MRDRREPSLRLDREALLLIRMLLALAMFFAPTIASGIVLGFITGNKYLSLNEAQREIWLVGAMDGIMAQDTVALKDLRGPWLGRCVDGMPVSQIKGIFEQELSAKPGEWHAPAALILHSRLATFCRRTQ